MSLQLGARHWRAVLAVVVTLLGAGAAAAADGGAKLPVPVVIVVDMQAAQRDSVAAQSLRTQREQVMQKYQTEFEATRKALKETENALVTEKSTMTPEAWQAKARSFEQQVAEFNRRYQTVLQAVEKSYTNAMGQVMQAFIRVTEEVANEYGANLVLQKQQVFLHDPRMDVTATVVERLNKSLPSVAMQSPAVEGEAAAAPKKPARK
ncbi:MAG: OmpH family outer membrane protein [Actinomycetota bacterium]